MRTIVDVFMWTLGLLTAVVCQGASAPDVPAGYVDLYRGLDAALDAADSRVAGPKDDWRPESSVDLLAANSNRGPALLHPQTLEAVQLSLDRFRAMGIQNVKFALQYPMLRPDFPNAADYLAFYKRVVDEAHERGMKVMPHVTVLFADTPFSPFKGIYRGLDLGRFRREYRDMVHLVVRELKPDYLGLITEPDTQARLTGLRELDQPQAVADVVRFTLTGLDRGKTLIGAGSGSWSPPAFAKALAEQTDVDFIAIHIYPITAPMLANAVQMARTARANRKLAVIDEAWLYKILKPGGGDSVAASSDVYRRDAFSFWEPLDKKFIALVLKLARTEHVSLVSFFWSGIFFGYLDYTPELERLPYRELAQRHNRVVYRNMREGTLTGTGKFHRDRTSVRPSAFSGVGIGRNGL